MAKKAEVKEVKAVKGVDDLKVVDPVVVKPKAKEPKKPKYKWVRGFKVPNGK